MRDHKTVQGQDTEQLHGGGGGQSTKSARRPAKCTVKCPTYRQYVEYSAFARRGKGWGRVLAGAEGGGGRRLSASWAGMSEEVNNNLLTRYR